MQTYDISCQEWTVCTLCDIRIGQVILKVCLVTLDFWLVATKGSWLFRAASWVSALHVCSLIQGVCLTLAEVSLSKMEVRVCVDRQIK